VDVQASNAPINTSILPKKLEMQESGHNWGNTDWAPSFLTSKFWDIAMISPIMPLRPSQGTGTPGPKNVQWWNVETRKR
jgi:hypothetical protein